ncbi:hypothetical protein P1J78_03655 [Psychromarinibacter sp. C21-152]|uniref:Uncharacterized protein n=1 Tax=Psychromarinibacter sediminicola TaxID=3033385 RepID=A0AAE3NPW2_9RHOB|nr:hypothetical protein [Psychromarinibacter sediminicola]MDF0599821.1 hypothetical protein [Psychromarinibacter sediminicola]
MKTARFAPARSSSVQSFNHDGLELARRKPHRRKLPVAKFVQFALAVFAFRLFLFLQMGALAYTAKMEALADGALLERLAGKAMALDPVTLYIADMIRFAL